MTRPGETTTGLCLTPVDRVHVGFYGFVLVVSLLRIGALPEAWKPLAWYGGVLAAALLLAFALRGRSGLPAILPRIVFSFPAGAISFLMLSFVVPYANPWHGERLLYEIDTAMFFGANPNVLLDRIAWPPLTEVLQFVYTVYYAIPVVLLVCLLRERRVEALTRGTFDVMACLFLSYVGYFVIPATGPNLNVLGLYPPYFTEPMEGLRFAEGLREALHEAEWIKQDCWPSGHTALSLVCLGVARREGSKAAFAILLVPVSLLIFSTMYLRYHYVIDVVCGFALAWAVMRWAPSWRRAWGEPAPPPPA